MVLVLWSPVAVPLLPTLVQSWTTKNPSRIAELACIVGLYTAVTILVMQWGKRIRGYENPPEQYGLDLTSLPNVWFGKYSFFFNGLDYLFFNRFYKTVLAQYLAGLLFFNNDFRITAFTTLHIYYLHLFYKFCQLV